MVHSKMVIQDFDRLIGKEALWQMAVRSLNEKARDIAQELLANCHLKFNHKAAKPEQVQPIIKGFVDRCMQLLGDALTQAAPQQLVYKRNLVRLLTTFMDRYEGIRVLRAEQAQYASRMHSIKPINFDIINALDVENKYIHKTSVSMFQTVGHLRQKIANEIGVQVNEFSMVMRNVLIDPDIEDDKYLKDINGLSHKALIKRNNAYQPQLHPKFILAKEQQHFSTIFSMLQGSSPELCIPVWSLINKLPQNPSVIESLQSLDFVRGA